MIPITPFVEATVATALPRALKARREVGIDPVRLRDALLLASQEEVLTMMQLVEVGIATVIAVLAEAYREADGRDPLDGFSTDDLDYLAGADLFLKEPQP